MRLGAGSEASIDDMKLMLRYHEQNLVKGAPEFERAKELVWEHDAIGTFEWILRLDCGWPRARSNAAKVHNLPYMSTCAQRSINVQSEYLDSQRRSKAD